MSVCVSVYTVDLTQNIEKLVNWKLSFFFGLFCANGKKGVTVLPYFLHFTNEMTSCTWFVFVCVCMSVRIKVKKEYYNEQADFY